MMRAQSNHKARSAFSALFGAARLIYACQRKDVDACRRLWGGRVVMGKEELMPRRRRAVEMTKNLCCPLLGIFGNATALRAPSR